MAAAAAAEESMSMAALAMSVPDSTVGSPRAEGEGVGVAREEKDATTKGTEAFGDSEEDGDDVFEVEKILDMKCEGVCGGCAARTRLESRGGAGTVGANPRGTPSCLAGRTCRASAETSRTGPWPAASVEDGCVGKF